MKWNHSTYKLIKSLRPIDLYEIMTRGVCSDYTEEIKRQVISIRGEWFLNNWHNEIKLDVLDLYLSDTGFKLFTTKKEAERLEGIFKSWGLFYEVWSKWYGGDDVYTVGFNYDYTAFNDIESDDSLYFYIKNDNSNSVTAYDSWRFISLEEWRQNQREKKLNELGI